MTLEQLFSREFKSAVVLTGNKDIFSIPLPESSKNWEVSGVNMYAIQNIEDTYYGNLNKSIVSRVPPENRLARRRIDKAKRSFMRDESGNFVYDEVVVPTGSMAVVSEIKIGLPYNYKLDGFDYVDFVEKPNGVIEFIYIIPKKFLYQVNQTALVLSVKNMKNYSGMGYTTWRNGRIFLHIIPYKPSASYVGSKVLKTGYSLNFSAEIKEIIAFWINNNLIPNITLTELSTGENLALKKTDVGYNEFIPIESLSLGDREIYGYNIQEQEGDSNV